MKGPAYFSSAEFEKLNELESKYHLKFPLIYKKFYSKCRKSTPKKWVGSDFFHNNAEMKEQALNLLKENEIENFLNEQDFIFMMHQGYMFWYFEANGSENPLVYFYSEQNKSPQQISDLASFLCD